LRESATVNHDRQQAVRVSKVGRGGIWFPIEVIMMITSIRSVVCCDGDVSWQN